VKKSPELTDKHVGTRVRMRRLMLEKSQTELATALGITFQQVQKYEKGTNRISASRLQQISDILQTPVPFFFEGLPGDSNTSRRKAEQPAPEHLYNFLATPNGVSLVKAFVQIKNKSLRQAIVRLVEEASSSKP
jgi:transcriptional regulator with XRE-family HTH domain